MEKEEEIRMKQKEKGSVGSLGGEARKRVANCKLKSNERTNISGVFN